MNPGDWWCSPEGLIILRIDDVKDGWVFYRWRRPTFENDQWERAIESDFLGSVALNHLQLEPLDF